MRFVLLAIIAILFCQSALSSNCTDACNASYAGKGELITFCSQNGVTFTAPQVALHPITKIYSSCYAQCGESVLHVGVCGCPNNCYNDLGRGTCDTTNQVCTCNAGWGGKDCSAIKCPNSCSGHGTCVAQASTAGGDICTCQDGWTAYDCSVQIPQTFRTTPFGALPYGEIPEGGDYYKHDDYKDEHQFFNSSRVATVKIWVSEENEKYLLDPLSIFEQEYVPAKMYYNNGLISRYRDVEFRIKGSSTRINPKKSWNVKFLKGDSWKKLKGFSLKTNIADRVVTSQLIVEFYRAHKVETYRSSVAEFFFNDRYYGVERLEERLDDNFMESRWDVDDTNMYKVGPYSMEYLGENPETYANYSTILFDHLPVYGIEQEEGNDDFSDFAGLVSALNKSTPVATAYLTQHFDLPVFYRAMALETITKNADAYLSTGNNYLLTDVGEDDDRPFWNYGAYDFDVAMIPLEDSFAPVLGMTGDQLRALMASGVTTIYGIPLSQYILSDNPYDLIARPKKPLANAIFRIAGSNDSFTQDIRDFVKRVIVDHANVTQVRREAYVQLTRSLVARDRMYAIMPTTSTIPGKGLETFDQTCNSTYWWIENRWSYLASMFYANGHGKCNSVGQCTCYDNYFGQACEQFCGVTFTQTQTNSWTSGSQQWSQWSVTINVGSQPLYAAIIQAIPNAATFSPYGIEQVPSSSNLYTIPSYQYSSGTIPANSNSVTFGYTISSAQPAYFRLNQNACIPKACPVGLVTSEVTSWNSGSNHYQQLKFTVTNQASTAVSSVKLQMDFYGNSFVSSSWNIAPSTSTAGTLTQNFTCSLYNLQPSNSYDGCGLTLSVPTSYSATNTVFADVHVASAICL